MSTELQPVHGFVLAGGKSSRMRQDKAMLPLSGVPLVENAVTKLAQLCSCVSILGDRDDLLTYAPVVHDLRSNAGPGAAFEAALQASHHDWSMFMPIDVPFMPTAILERWCIDVLRSSVAGASFLVAAKYEQPAFALVHRLCGPSISRALDRGERRLLDLLYAADRDKIAPVLPRNVERYDLEATQGQIESWFRNINTPEELAEAEAWMKAEG